jgi:hypothetical protein
MIFIPNFQEKEDKEALVVEEDKEVLVQIADLIQEEGSDREEDLVQVEDLGEVISNFSDLLLLKE